MSVFENIKMALSSLLAHKMRSILTMLGIIIGVASVIAVVAIGQGGEAMLKSEFAGESNTTEITYRPSDEELENSQNAIIETGFTDEDIRAIKKVQGVDHVIKASMESGTIRYHEDDVSGSITGINEEYIDVNNLDVGKGRSLTTGDFIAGNRSAIVSSNFRDELFDGEDMVGKVIYIGSQPLEIAGVLEEGDGGILDIGTNDVYIPFKTWRNVFNSSDVNQVSIQADSPEKLEEAGHSAVSVLNRMHDKDGSYEVIDMEAISEGIGQVTSVMTIIIGSVAGVSLFVGGIGVMNIMLVSVTERTREIGIRMSLGATRGQILTQFLIESVTLTLCGGLIGMLLGSGAAQIVSQIAGWPSLVSFPVILGGILFSMAIGVIFGILPANKAARMNPINALSRE